MTVVKIDIPLKPVPKGRPRLGGGKVYTPSKTKKFEQQVAFLTKAGFNAKGVKPFAGPVFVYVWFVFKGKNVGFNHTTSSDIDNLQKSVFDGMNGIAYLDDRQIVQVLANKVWGEDDHITIWVSDSPIMSTQGNYSFA